MASKVLKSEPIFRELNGKGGLDIEAALQQFALRQGVGCDGILHGLKFTGGTPAGDFTLSVEVVNGVNSLVIRDCKTNTIVDTFGASGGTAPLAKQYRSTILGANGSVTSTTVSHTDFSMALNVTYSAEGVYLITAASGTPFTNNKTTAYVTNQTATGGVLFIGEITSTSVITIRSFLSSDGTTAADFIGKISVQVVVDA